MQDHEKIEPTVDALPEAGESAANDAQAPEAAGGPEHLLKAAQAEAKQYQESWIRAKAEADNIRKRAQADIANAHKYALEGFAAELLGVRDSLEAALATQGATPEALRSGVELTLKQLASAFDKAGVREINPLGEKFDPHKHQGINMVDSDAEPNTVVGVLQKGYALNDRIIRPALVTIAKPRTSA